MFIILGSFQLPPEDLSDFHTMMATMIPQTRAEDGCLNYVMLVEDAASGLIHVTEMWRDDAALLAHFKQPWTQGFIQRFSSRTTNMQIKIHDISQTRDLPPIG
jgi:quinol monooxygenase YgiN